MTTEGGRVTDTRKGLGRCVDRHVNIVTMANLTAACTKTWGKEGLVCGKPMVEWARRYPKDHPPPEPKRREDG